MYKFKEHTADIKIYSSGETFRDALQSLIDGIISLIGKKNTPTIRREHNFSANFEEDLVVGFIDDVLYNIEQDKIIPSKVIIKDLDEKSMTISYIIEGVPGMVENIIKAPTFHELIIKKEHSKWIMEVVLDV